MFISQPPCKPLWEAFFAAKHKKLANSLANPTFPRTFAVHFEGEASLLMTATTSIPLEWILTFLNSMTLSSQNKRWLGEHLIAQAMKEEGVADTHTHQTKVMKIKRYPENSPSDAELEARFAGLSMPELPADPDWNQVITANSGKTIRPIEKWL